MKNTHPLNLLFCIVILIGICSHSARAQVSITELEDRIRIEINGEIFTEWRHQDWVAPYLYPVVGPNGENITRNYPMKEGVPSESQDHYHHRSLRFGHSDVNGLNFWFWRLGKERETSKAEIKLEKIERISSGKTGEVVLWNQWLNDGELVMREKVRLAFTPLENRQVLMDFDIEFHPGKNPVTLGDQKDGGMLVRVAGTMKAAQKNTGKKLAGTILNSRGDVDSDAWGKAAEWVDYYGPDTSGKTVGIAMFDHPKNLRFPTQWHARTYGLLAANRFSKDHFDPKFAKAKGVPCRPFSKDCPACKSRGGSYTIPVGESLSLRHRFYFHHGDSKSADVEGQYADYAVDAVK